MENETAVEIEPAVLIEPAVEIEHAVIQWVFIGLLTM